MAEYEEERKSRGEQAAEEGARFGARRFAEKGAPGAARGAAASGAGTTAGAAGTAGGTAAGGAAAGGTAAGGAAAGGAAAGTATAPGVGTAVGAAAGAAAAAAVSKAKYIVPAAIGLLIVIPTSAFLLIIAMPLMIIMLFLGVVEIGEATEGFTVTKTVSPDYLDNGVSKGDKADVTYTITVTNDLDVEVTGITLDDPECDAINNIQVADLDAQGSSEPIVAICPVTTYPGNEVYTNTVTATGSAQYVDIDGDLAPESVGDTDNARVIIGDPPDLPPTGCPIEGIITTPYGTNIPGYTGGTHLAVDIVGGGSSVRSTIDGTAALGSSVEGGYHVTVCNKVYCVRFVHLDDGGRISGEVSVGDIVGTEDNTGTNTTGPHLHYIVFDELGNPIDPIQFMPVTLNYTPPAGLDFSGFAESPAGGWGSCNALP